MTRMMRSIRTITIISILLEGYCIAMLEKKYCIFWRKKIPRILLKRLKINSLTDFMDFFFMSISPGT